MNEDVLTMRGHNVKVYEGEDGHCQWEVNFRSPTILPKDHVLNFNADEKELAVNAAKNFVAACRAAPKPPNRLRKIALTVCSIKELEGGSLVEAEVVSGKMSGSRFNFPLQSVSRAEQSSLNIGTTLLAMVDSTKSTQDILAATSITVSGSPS